MKITPLEIQQMVFKVRFRGYDREDVERFLEDIAGVVESLNRENADLHEKLTAAEGQLAELKKSEGALANTLVAAQAVGEDLKQSAKRDADQIVKEAEFRAYELLREARSELVNTQRDLADLRKQRVLMLERLRSTLQSFERVLEVEADHGAQADPEPHADRLADRVSPDTRRAAAG